MANPQYILRIQNAGQNCGKSGRPCHHPLVSPYCLISRRFPTSTLREDDSGQLSIFHDLHGVKSGESESLLLFLFRLFILGYSKKIK